MERNEMLSDDGYDGKVSWFFSAILLLSSLSLRLQLDLKEKKMNNGHAMPLASKYSTELSFSIFNY